MPLHRLHGHLSPQFRQHSIHIGLKPLHNGYPNDTGHIVHGTHDIHPLVSLQDELEINHITVPNLEITEYHGIASP
jgi:hypothetical protein